jgi:hypothetical protein
MVSPNERCFSDTSAKDIWPPCAQNGGTAVLHIDEGARFQAHYTIIADRDTGTHTDSRFATLNRAFRDQRRIVSEVVFVFAALWYADSFIHRKQTCLASSKVLGASGQLQNERRRMRKLGQVPPALKSSLTDFQIAWVRLQARALNISCERLTGTILNEWLSDHPRMLVGRHDSKEIFRRALDDFIRCHSAEFLPVSLSDLLDQS